MDEPGLIMPAHDDAWFQRAAARIVKLMVVFAAAGTMAAFFWRGWLGSAGFAVGAAISWLNFRWLKQLTDALGGPPLRRGRALFLGLRYLILGGGAYVILRYSQISLTAVLAGLFVSIAAVIVEILFELGFAR